MSFVDLELWLVEVAKSDVREWRVFAEPVTYDNYQEVVITQWYCSYHIVLCFDVWLHCDRIYITGASF